ncbi:MAG: signal peptidase II [Rickettsiales bacterium]|jgi:signal peptidase II|nr:signal peptidase II [Rickettsiales bacterium]
MGKIIAILTSAVLADQIAKGVLLSMVADGWHLSGDAFALVPFPFMMWRLTNWFNIVFTWNPGTSFSMFREVSPFVMIFLTGMIIGFLGYHLFTRIRGNVEVWAMSLIVGGALGNLIDRVRFGAVIDFVDWHVGTWHWPAFNIADVCICVGVGLYILHWINQRKKLWFNT